VLLEARPNGQQSRLARQPFEAPAEFDPAQKQPLRQWNSGILVSAFGRLMRETCPSASADYSRSNADSCLHGTIVERPAN